MVGPDPGHHPILIPMAWRMPESATAGEVVSPAVPTHGLTDVMQARTYWLAGTAWARSLSEVM
jgi:hypothetical protein